MVCRTVLIGLAALTAEARPLKVVIDGKTLPELRGTVTFSQLAAEAPGPAPAVAPAPAEGPELGLCGCPSVPEDQCTCGASLSFLQCVHTKCAAGECECPKESFESECSALSYTCSSEMNLMGCHSLHTSCEGRYHQAANGVVGLTLDTTGLTDDAFCGPHGRCTGDIHVNANIYRPVPGAWLECVIPTGEKRKLYHCSKEVTDKGASDCTLGMPSYIAPSDAVRGHCFLTDGKHGKKITKDAWFVVRNRYSPSEAVVAAAPKAVKATKKNVVLERADEADAAEKQAEIKEEEVEEEIEEEGVEKSEDTDKDAKEKTKEDSDSEYIFEKYEAAPVKEGVGAKTKEPKASWTYTWIPLVVIALLVLGIGVLIAAKRRSESV